MKIDKIYNIINDLIQRSNGNLIEINGKFFSFKRRKLITQNDIFQYEKNSGMKLPIEYCDFLLSVGSCALLGDEYGEGYIFLAPNELIDWQKEVLQEEYPIIHDSIILIMSNPNIGYIGGFHLKENLNHFGIIYPDIPPEIWINEVIFQSLNEWLDNLLSEYI